LFEINNLSFCEQFSVSCQKILTQIHECDWDSDQSLSGTFHIRKVLGDFRHFRSDEKFDVIYYDAFAPEVQPELWTEEMFKKVASLAAPGAILTTYSSKGLVRRNLQYAGFAVEKLPGPPGKREFVRATMKT
jgi:tRNA U34 5-methylaminomethyl-2-thiouridine-forming methyltransferase MnmC